MSVFSALVFGAVVTFLLSFSFGRSSDLASRIRPASVKETAAAAVPKGREKKKREGAGSRPGVLSVLLAAAFFVAALSALRRPEAAALAGVLGAVLPGILERRRRAALAKAVSEKLPVALVTMSSALRGGASLAQALEQAADESPEPLGSELRRVDAAVKLGASPADALDALRSRVKSPDLDLVAVATRIITRTGGDLPRLYDYVGETIREREAFRKSVGAYTAQARASGAVVSVMPLLVTAGLWVMNPGYFRPLLQHPLGRPAFFLSFCLIGVGWLVVKRMLSVVIE